MTATLVAGGCSTVLRGTHEKFTVTSEPKRALCRIYRGGEGYLKAVATPGSVYLRRSPEPLKVVCKKRGYKTATAVAGEESFGLQSASLGNAFSLGIDTAALGVGAAAGGAALDIANNAYVDMPDSIHVVLEKVR